MTLQQTVLLTDRAWPDDSIERGIIEDAGFRLVAGPADPAPVEAIDALIAEHQPSAILTCWATVSAEAIASSAPLRVVARMGVGLDNIAVPAATDRGVQVTNVPDYCVEEVSDHAVGLALAWTRGLVAADREVRAGRWNPAGARLRRLSNLTCGVVGYGRIGRATAAKLKALGARVVISDPHPPADTGGSEVMALDGLLAASDIVVLHAPLVPQTHHLIGARELALLPQDAFLINVSRGGLVDTAALLAALQSGKLGGAGLDVLEEEPTVPAGLLAHPGVIVTPHIAFASDASVIDLRRSAAEEVVRVLRGEPANYPCNTPSVLATGVSL
ncbi:C-terminal binding protein [Arthrobacter sp. CDRTa11]|uniref:C-terminal binding protein n=1 Tax=Arthrobacter sp. CDRTa11 TaxID=2651199 RepID=UPI002265F715|nr:C-terminal binding protein [Arthrobacter sp. CDRTa11]UZX03063.1 C-terminal binding protein [Arthrobacter sp. CDRTa11]